MPEHVSKSLNTLKEHDFFGCLHGIQFNVWNVISLAKSLLLCISDVSNFYHCNKQCWDEHHCTHILWLFPLEKILEEELHSQKDRTCFMWKLVGDILFDFWKMGALFVTSPHQTHTAVTRELLKVTKLELGHTHYI